MEPVILTRNLTARGFDAHELARMQRRGELVRVRRGAYVSAQPDSDDSDDYVARAARLATRHRQLIEGTLPQLHPRAVISHGSAALLHDLPVFPEAVRRLHLTRDRHGGGVRRPLIHVHGSALPAEDVTVVDQIPVTSLARTVVDLARTLPYEQAVALGARALAQRLDAADLAVAVDRAMRRSGAAQARRVAAFIDGRSESVGESFSRVRFDRDGVPAPEPQLEVYDDGGVFVARSDFGWTTSRTLGEFDGREKYLRLRRSGESIEAFVLREKQREDALRDLGWQVVRWVWADLFRPRVIADRLERAYERART
jgi:predicted transcriptional regulator of viral defense system